MAVSEYDKKNLSASDQAKIAEVTAKAERGEMSWADAHSAAETIRGNAGYSGGRYGNEYNTSGGGSSGGSGGGSGNGTVSSNRVTSGGNSSGSGQVNQSTPSAPALNQYGYRDGFDYSDALRNPNLSAAERSQLTQERQNKITYQYGGVEPNMIGSNQRFSDTQQGGGNTYRYKGIDYTQTGGGLYGVPTLDSKVKNQTVGGVTYGVGPNMARRTDLRNQYAISNGYTVFYDADGYATKAMKGVIDYAPHLDLNVKNGSYNTSGAWTDNEILSADDQREIAAIRRQLQEGKITGDQANAKANAIRAGYGYTIDKNGYVTDNGALSAVNDRRSQWGLSTNPEGGSTAYYRYLMGTDTSPAAQAAGKVKSYATFAQENGYGDLDVGAPIFAGANGEVPTGTTVPLPGNSASDLDWGLLGGNGSGGAGSRNPGVSDAYDPGSMNDYLDRWYQDAQEQQKNAIDFGTNQGVNELIRAQQDAEAQYQAQRNQIAIDEAKAKDNQALYAEARGDKGGIGAAQYDSIMNTAAQNRLQVNSAQTKLATDTARQIADLRAQGEYEKADALLQLSQQYLSQLMSLEQWGMEYNLSVAQFNASLQQWEKEYDLKVADLLGSYNGTPTLSAQQFAFNQQQYQDELTAAQDQRLASAGETLLAAGIMPSASQLNAMGMTQNDAQNYITALKVQQVSKASKSGGGSGSSSGSGSGSGSGGTADIDGLFAAALGKDNPWSWVKNNYKKYGLSAQPDKSEFEAYQQENTYSEDEVSATAKAWYTDLYKLYGSQEDRLNAIIQEYNNGNGWMTNADRLYLLEKLNLL